MHHASSRTAILGALYIILERTLMQPRVNTGAPSPPFLHLRPRASRTPRGLFIAQFLRESVGFIAQGSWMILTFKYRLALLPHRRYFTLVLSRFRLSMRALNVSCADILQPESTNVSELLSQGFRIEPLY
jgi:hypothetical protein